MIGVLSGRLRGVAKLPWPLRYLLSALAAVGALGLGHTVGGPPFLFFFPTIVFVAVVFDHGCSAFTTLLSAALAARFTLYAERAAVTDYRQAMALIVFVITGLVVGAIVEAMRHAIDELSKANIAMLHAAMERDSQIRLLDAITEGTPDPVYVKDSEGRFVLVNSAAAGVLGAPRDSVRGTRDRDYLDAESATAIEANDRAIMTDGAIRTIEERVRQPGGTLATFFSSKFPWRDADGTIIGIIGMSQDISQIKDGEARLKASDAQKELLLDDINHRIKNHLQTIGGLMSVAQRRCTSLDEAKDIIGDAVSRLSVLAQVYTRLQVASGETAVDARGFITDLCHDLNATLVGLRAVAIRCEVGPATLDSSRSVTLGLVINELVQNALKYAFPDDRNGEVRITFHRDDDTYRLTVADNGIGMPPSAEPTGTGNGRRLLRAMTQQLAGTLTTDSSAGTRIELVFPVTGPAGPIG